MTAAPPNVLVQLRAALDGRYRVERELGAGGMATVYLATDLRHDRDVAIKVLHPELGAALGSDRFLAEIRTTARLQHPHILPLLDSGAADGLLYYVMPYVTGETLRARLEREGQLRIDDALLIAREVADALGAAHALGIVHRDIKPENILLQGGHALVADFGIALAVQHAGGQRMTQTGLSLGTPQYMSPEQAMGERVIDARSDVYALGAVTYEMLVGEPPFTGPTVQAIVAKVMSAEPERPTLVRKSIPPHVEDAVLTALAKLPADRFASAAELAAALASDAPRRRSTTAVHAGAATRPWRAIGLAAGGVAIGTLAALGWTLTRKPGAAGPTEYDVGLPDSAAFRGLLVVGFAQAPVGLAVSPGGDFAVYQTTRNGHAELWYRSLRDATTRLIEATTDGTQPAVSPDGNRLAFLRVRGREWTVDVVPVSGGNATTLGRGNSGATLQWLADGRILVSEGDGTRARWLDPSSGASTTSAITYCVLPSSIPRTTAFLCGGGAQNAAYRVDPSDDVTKPGAGDIGEHGQTLRRAGNDSSLVFGTDFRIVDSRYVTYMLQGDLMAASFDAATGRIGRPVRMLSGIGQSAYYQAGTYALSASGTLVYAEGRVHAVGSLVRASDRGMDTLPVPPEAYITFTMEPGGRRLAAVVDGREGQELRIYDLVSGKSVLWVRRPFMTAPAWSPSGGRIAFATRDTVFVGDPDDASPPAPAFVGGEWEVYNWLPDDRLVGVSWKRRRAEVQHLDRRPATIDSLFGDAAFVRVSPDGRWIAYNNWDLTRIWLEPFPRTGKRWEVASGNREEPHWLSPTELFYTAYDPSMGFERVRLDPNAANPIVERRHWIDAPGMVGTAGPSSMPTTDGRVVYLQGAPDVPVRYLRVIPNWVERMKRAVDEAAP
jgi:eukaryotic-like serine/threonine-protein kinase